MDPSRRGILERSGFLARFARVVAAVSLIGSNASYSIAAEDPPGPTNREAHSRGDWPKTGVVTVPALDVHDRPEDQSYVDNRLTSGDPVTVRAAVGDEWLAIDPPATSFWWIEQSAIDRSAVNADRNAGARHPGKPSPVQSTERAWVSVARAVVRDGNPRAKLPGPPIGGLREGSMVRLVDRPPLSLGSGDTHTQWYAILPAWTEFRFIRASGIRFTDKLGSRDDLTRAAFAPSDDPFATADRAASADWKSELAKVETLHREIVASQPIERWRFDVVRTGYEAVLKRFKGDPQVEEAVRARLARVTQHEQAAESARQIRELFTKSHRRDSQVAAIRKPKVATKSPAKRSFSAVGFVQPSARKVDGRKLYALIGTDGSTLAYLDVPPGIDVERLFSRKVGVRGDAHFDEDLGARLITVRDIDSVNPKR